VRTAGSVDVKSKTPDPFDFPTYDDLDRRATVTQNIIGVDYTTTYSYDADGNVIEEDTPEGVIHYEYDPATGRHKSTWTANSASTLKVDATTEIDYGYDELGRLTSATTTRMNNGNVNLLTTYAYDADGNKAHEALPNDVSTDYTYDTLNRLVDVNTADATGKSLLSQTFTLNKDGTRASLHQTQLQNDNTTIVTTDTNWAYDLDGRLSIEGFTSSAAGESYGNLFGYDLAGNRLYQQHTGPGGGGKQTTNYTYDQRNELTDQNGTTFTYDNNGSELSSSDGRSFTYDVRNKMVGATVNGQASTYLYDDNGNRVAETTGGTTTYYLTDHANPTGYAQPIEAKLSPTANPTQTYLIGDHVFGQVNSTGTVSYLQTDGHGSTEQLTDSTGAVTQAFRYDAFGGAINFDLNIAGTPFLFGGDAIYDPASGLYQHGDFTRGRDGFRFIQRDSGGYGTNTDPLSLHTYLFDRADPLNHMDASGHDFSLAETLLTVGIQGVLGSLSSAIIKPAAEFINKGLFGALLPPDIMGHLSKINWTNLSAIMIGGSVGYTVSYGPFGIGGALGAEFLWSPHTNHIGGYGFVDVNLSLFGSHGPSAGIKVGAVFNARTLGDYEGPFRSITIGYHWLPKKLQSVFSKAAISSHMLTIPPGTTSLIPTKVPGLTTALLQAGRYLLADVATRIDNKAITIFWTPYRVGSFGFAIENQFGEEGSSGIATGLQKYFLLPGFSSSTTLL
jgi:YD repeat-containing protein